MIKQLSGRLSRLLQALLDQQGTIVSKETLIARTWGSAGSEQSLARGIADLRRILSSSDSACIQTIYGAGYRLLYGPSSPIQVSRRNQARSVCLEAEHRLVRRDTEQMMGAVRLFRLAVQIDPQCWEALIGLAKTQLRLGAQGTISMQECVRSARGALTDAISIEPECADAYALLGLIHSSVEWNDSAAWTAFSEANQLSPVSFLVNYYTGWFWINCGVADRATMAFRKAVEIEPASVMGMGWLAFAELRSAPEAARRAAASVMELDPTNPMSLFFYCVVEGSVGDAQAAVDAGARLCADWSDIPLARSAHAYTLARLDRRSEAMGVLAGTNADQARWATEEAFSALAHHANGDDETALRTLQAAKKRGDIHLRFVLHQFPWVRVRGRPAFRALLSSSRLHSSISTG